MRMAGLLEGPDYEDRGRIANRSIRPASLSLAVATRPARRMDGQAGYFGDDTAVAS
jgi:hypothetical protein